MAAALVSLRAVIASIPGAAAFVDFPEPAQGGPVSQPVYRDPAKLCGQCRHFKPWPSNVRVGTCENAAARLDGYCVGHRDGCADFALGTHPAPAHEQVAAI
jgi:hypothetical protein